MWKCNAHLGELPLRPPPDPNRVCMSARRVQRAFPVRELAADTDTINVEMDPEDELRVRSSIAADHGMQCATRP